MKIILIAAVAKNKVIGKNNQLIWKLPSDLKRFKNLTSGHYILMGRKTFESLGKPLPNRTHLIITRNPEFKAPEGHYAFQNLEEAFIFCNKIGVEELFIIGGGQIYRESISMADELEITEVDMNPEGDTYFPEIDPEIWAETSREEFPADDRNECAFAFVTFERR